MEEGFALWANPSSPHAEGRKARAALEDARERVKQALGWEGEVIFTSGASEAAALAFNESQAMYDAVSKVEHDALWSQVEHRGASAIEVAVDGSIDFTSIEKSVVSAEPYIDFPFTVAVGAQHINSETGNRQDIGSIASLVHGNDGLLMADCSQSAGKFAIPKVADMAIVSAHKFGGPIGVGALLVRDFSILHPRGGQERGYRRGTENLPGALGMAVALEACGDPYLDPAILEPLDQLAQECRDLGGTWLSDRLSDPTPFIRAIAMPKMSGSAQVMRFDMAGISVSQGSACSSGTMKTSHVLQAMQVEPDVADRTIRASFGWNTKRKEVERFAEVWLELAKS